MNSNPFRNWALLLAGFSCTIILKADDRRVDPTFLRRNVSAAQETASDLTTATCHYKPLFGEGDRNRSIVIGVARYAELVIDPNGTCTSRNYPQQDQVYVVLEGTGSVEY